MQTGAPPTLIPPTRWGEAPVVEAADGQLDTPGLVLPVGTVTLLLADVEGSTRLWEADPAAMTDAVAGLDSVLAEVVGRHGGVRPLEQGEGDSFVVAFARASDAAACALELQLAELSPVRLRIGIHTGEAQLRDEANYIGAAINRAARLRDLGHGGQTLLSQAAADLVADRLPPSATLADLGTHRLRDLARPEHVHQLSHPGLAGDFGALRSLDAYPHNLPVQLTSFVGRTTESGEVAALLSESRLVTLIGSGGAGKTRLALQVAADTLASHPDGAFQADLAPLADPGLVAIAFARALGLQDEPSRTTVETIVHHTGAKAVLVVLDNCEHLINACASLVETLLLGCRSLVVLATSREPLGVRGEVTYRVPSLSLPSDTGPTPVGALGSSEAVQLFIERAGRARPGFALTEANATAVAEICRRLDGIPLGIELAAARVRVFSPDQIAAGLHDRFRLLTGGARTALPRQQTLRASVDWSHALLTGPEQILFRRLAAFAGSFDFSAAEAVGAGEGLEAHQVLDQLVSLVDKSLLVATEDTDTRYRLLETVRQYALERLADSGEAEAVRRRHRDHYRGALFALSGWSRLREGGLGWAETELDNLRAAIAWSLDAGEVDAALLMPAMLLTLWTMGGRLLEGVELFETALARAGDAGPVAHAMGLAMSALLLGGYRADPTAVSRAEESLALARRLGNHRVLGVALIASGNSYLSVDPNRAVAFYSEARELAREVGDPYRTAVATHGVGIAHWMRGHPEVAVPLLREADAAFREVQSQMMGRQNAAELAIALIMCGELQEALSLAKSTAPAAT